MINDLKTFLDSKADQYNQPAFIENDPVVIPHQFSLKQDIEISGFFASMLAWGQRKTIINKCRELMERMDTAPFDFILNHQEDDLKSLLGFKHRTFNDTDLLYFVHFFKQHYEKFGSLEDAFLPKKTDAPFRADYFDESVTDQGDIESASPVCYSGELIRTPVGVEAMLNSFKTYFFSLPDFPSRTIKHVSSPRQKSTCKRLNMFLRWMVRKDNNGVDFGLWSRISPSQLICPCDVHVERVARKLNLITRKQVDWQAALELTERLREFDPSDPVKYDFALFGLGIEEKFGF
ncbi:TIGR02757 family protein [Desertivirga xinjiangensis]|uniref:TIGR02757 family protein n=1 Tax=Desertivirga xinjiangensis TaxID=539206 RepID=UPI002108A16C|nr:TIGR02757 family protein [Pedobacter xinjiangensis]